MLELAGTQSPPTRTAAFHDSDRYGRNQFEFSARDRLLDGESAWSLFVNAVRENAPADRIFVVRHDVLLSDAQRVIDSLLMSL